MVFDSGCKALEDTHAARRTACEPAFRMSLIFMRDTAETYLVSLVIADQPPRTENNEN